MGYEGRWKTVKVEVEGGIAWVTLNRPDKRNAMSPTLNAEMIDVLEEDDDVQTVWGNYEISDEIMEKLG